MYRIEIDRELCSGFGACAEAAPAVFALDGSGIVSLLAPGCTDEADAVLEAARSCPMGAIYVVDAESGKRID